MSSQMPLSEDAQKVLRVLLSCKMLRGRDLLSHTGLTPEKLHTAVEPLVDNGIVETSRPGQDAESVAISRYSLRPSAAKYVEQMLSSRW